MTGPATTVFDGEIDLAELMIRQKDRRIIGDRT